MMIRRVVFPAALLAVVIFGLSGCGSTLDQAPIGTAQRVALDSAQPEFNNLYHDGMFYFAGQPTQEGLRTLAGQGVTTVINLRSEDEMTDRVDFDEPLFVKELGMRYVNLPMSPKTYSPKTVDALANVLRSTKGKVLLHCGSSNRVGVLWANYTHSYCGLDLDEAIRRGKAAGMTRESLVDLVRTTAACCE